MLYTNTIEPKTLVLLKRITDCTWAKGLRLVGGTALALQYGHRRSIDLDFFGNIGCDADEMPDLLRSFGKLTILKLTPNIRIFTIDGVKVDFVNYSYPWIDDADPQPLPKMFFGDSWSEIKHEIRMQVANYESD